MVLPLLPLIAVAGAGAIAGVGTSSLLGGAGSGASNPTAVTNEAMFRNYSPTYSPTNVLTDSRSFADSRILNYSPSVIIDSPQATLTKKEAISAQAQAESVPQITTTPTTSGASFDEQRGTATSTGINPLWIIGGALIIGGAYYFGQKK